MCFHSYEDMERYKREAERNVRDKLPTTAMAIVRRKVGREDKFVGAMPVDWNNRQAIANVFRDLQHWHPDADVLDLTEINKVRRQADRIDRYNHYPSLDRKDLPYPSGKAEPYAFAGPQESWDDQVKEAAAYIHANNQKAARASA